MATTTNTTNNNVVGISKDAFSKIKMAMENFYLQTDLVLMNFSATAAQLDNAIKGSNIRASYNKMISDFKSQILKAAKMDDLQKILEGVFNQYTANDKKSNFVYYYSTDKKSDYRV